MAVAINCDMGEAFGLYRMGDDEAIMPLITIANVACGFHASDPVVMHKTVRLAKQHGVKVGAHPSLPDLQGFGRREMKIPRAELADIIVYQVGALKGFLEAEGHGAQPHQAARRALRHGGAAGGGRERGLRRRRRLRRAAVRHGRHPAREGLYGARGIAFVSEFYADLDYDGNGRPDHHPRAPCGRSEAGGRALRARGRGGQGQERRPATTCRCARMRSACIPTRRTRSRSPRR